MEKAIFLDRDGVINDTNNFYYVYRPEDFIINEGVFQFLENVTKRGYIILVISNQSGIAKNIYTKEQVEQVHNYLSNELKRHDVFLKNIYFCPHHNQISNCICRKPGSLMLEKAIARYQIDVQKSYLIGDSDRDIVAGEKVGLTSIKVIKNQNLNTVLDQIN